MIKSVSVVGAGTMGIGISHVFALNGFKVNLVDVSRQQLDKALELIDKNCNRQISRGSLSEEAKQQTLKNITTLTSLTNGVQDADLVVEAATENIDLKLKIFKQLDEAAPVHSILASKNCICHKKATSGNWYAFYESCSGDETG